MQARFPASGKEPEALALLEHTLKTMPWMRLVKRASLGAQVQFTDQTGEALLALVKRASQPHEDGQEGR